LPVEIGRAAPGSVDEFFKTGEREALKTLYDFSVIWHEQSYDFSATEDGVRIGAATIRVAASLAHVERVVVLPARRRAGIGRALLEAAADVANYYNCHKMTAMVPHGGAAQRFLEACDYKAEAVLPQHTFKLDIAVMRKFLL
jgi:GNAT superfamily N-acetyltransferase